MKATVNLDDDIVSSLRESTGIQGTSELVRLALVEMKQRYAAKKLASLGGTLPNLSKPKLKKASKSQNVK